MPVFASDTFTGTSGADIAGRAADVGGTWQLPGLATGTFQISNANRARSSTVGTGGNFRMLYVDAAPGTVDYDVQCDFIQLSTVTRAPGPAARMTADTTYIGYFVRWNHTSSLWELRRQTGLNVSTLLASYSSTVTLSQVYSVRLECRDAAKKVFLDGLEILSSADNTITAAGYAGIICLDGSPGSDTGGGHVDNWQAATPGGANDVEPDGFAATRGFGSATLSVGPAHAVAPNPTVRAHAFGTATLETQQPHQILATPAARVPIVADPTVTRMAGHVLEPAHVPPAAAFGTPTLTPGTPHALAPFAFAARRGLGTPELTMSSPFDILPAAFAAPRRIGVPNVSPTVIAVIAPQGFPATRAHGTPTVGITPRYPPNLASAVVRFLRAALDDVPDDDITANRAKVTGTPPYIVVSERSGGSFHQDSHARVTTTRVGVACHATTEFAADRLAERARAALLASGGIRLTFGDAQTAVAIEEGETDKDELPQRGPGGTPLWRSEAQVTFRSVRVR